jgi:hypothetical protein
MVPSVSNFGQHVARMATVVGAALWASFSSASLIQFDPDGLGPAPAINVLSVDYLPGNGVIQGIGDITSTTPGSRTGNLIYQARVGAFRNQLNQAVIPAGLNSAFEITVVMTVPVSMLFDPLSPPNTTFNYTASGPGTYQWYFDNNLGTQANDLAGTGFNDGLLILNGTLNGLSGVSQLIPSVGPLPPLDGHTTNNYPGIVSLRTTGGSTQDIDLPPGSLNPTFFLAPSPPSLISMVSDNQNSVTPFTAVDPSALFLGAAPNHGSVNGLGSDFQFQSDGNASFTTVPEPASIALCGCGLLGMLVFARRSK